jgi:anthranilate phosphoribosyltransferase
MPPRRADTLVGVLVEPGSVVPEAAWRRFWERLRRREISQAEALSVASVLSVKTPEPRAVAALLASLRDPSTARRPIPGTVNVVGTGGGPRTFNVSTAAAFVAATLGARVVKSGSRACTSRYGSVDLLERVGVPLTGSSADIERTLEAFGVAFAGGFVYPKELRLLAKAILPFDLRTVGRFFNTFGPFLATVPVAAQLTGVADAAVRPTFAALAATSMTPARVMIASNAVGVDELVSFEDNLVFDTATGRDVVVRPRGLGLGGGSLDGLRVGDGDVVSHFEAVLAGRGSREAIESVALNAAAVAVAAGAMTDWATAVRAAVASMRDAEPVRLLERMRRSGARVGVLR